MGREINGLVTHPNFLYMQPFATQILDAVSSDITQIRFLDTFSVQR